MRFIATIIFSLLLITGAQADNGLINVKSAHDVGMTLDKLQAALESKGMTIMARVNHAAGAQKAGLELPPTELLIFGNPKIGTPLMQCQRTVAIDLPQKALAWQDADGQVWLSYNDPAYLNQRHGLEDCAKVLEKVSGALANFAKAATE
jgi:uncharacterized protein (DUF302 family)